MSNAIVLYDGRGNKVSARYEAAYSSKVRSDISAPARSATRDTQHFTRQKLLELSRYFYKNSPTYAGMIERLVQYVVGSGHTARPKSSSETFNREAAAYWSLFAKDVDYSTPMNLLTLQNVIARTIFVDGDVASLLTSLDGLPKIQQIESHRIRDRVSSDWDKPDGVNISGTGRVQSYNVALDDDCREFKTFPSRNLILHLFPTRPNQYRGVPVATSALLTIHDLDDILALEKQAVKTFSARTFIIKNSSGEAEENFAFDKPESSESDAEREAHIEERVTNAHSLYLKNGEDCTTTSHDRPGPAWQGFVDFLTQSIYESTGFPTSLISGDKVGGADTRRELATAERAIAHWQNRLCAQMSRLYSYVIKFGIQTGAILSAAPDDWDEVRWQHPQRATVDWGRETAFDINAVKAGLMTLEDYFGKLGKDWREQLEQRALEMAYVKVLSAKYGVETQLILEQFKNVAQESENIGDEPASAKFKRAKARCAPGHCVHKWAKGGNGKQNKYGKLVNKLVKSSEAMRRINNSKGETITAADGNPAIYNNLSVKHIVKDHSFLVGKKRMEELPLAQDTTATGKHFESLNSRGEPQTEFIKEYDTGKGKKYFYTARRGKNNVVYSWYEISKNQYSRKYDEWVNKQKGGTR